MTDHELIELLKKQERGAQKQLFDRFSRLMLSVCRRYLPKPEDAEEALLNGFFKAMTNIDSFQEAGSFEGWVRRIMVNESLMMLRSRRQMTFPLDEARFSEKMDDFSIEAELSAREILDLLAQLPTGCRTVFNLFVLEGMRHHEIAELLGVSINTSKSQLLLARERLAGLVCQKFGS